MQTYLQQTQGQVQRLEQIFQQLGETPGQIDNTIVKAMLNQSNKLLDGGGDPAVLDVGLIGGAQIIEHYEIAGYGTARTYAQALGMTDAAQLLEQTLQEEKQTDEKITRLAEQLVNPKAQQAGS